MFSFVVKEINIKESRKSLQVPMNIANCNYRVTVVSDVNFVFDPRVTTVLGGQNERSVSFYWSQLTMNMFNTKGLVTQVVLENLTEMSTLTLYIKPSKFLFP